jgi:hypothetical protein
MHSEAGRRWQPAQELPSPMRRFVEQIEKGLIERPGRRITRVGLALLLTILCLALLGQGCASTTAPGQTQPENPYSQLLRGLKGPQKPIPLHTGSANSMPSTPKTPGDAAKTGASTQK